MTRIETKGLFAGIAAMGLVVLVSNIAVGFPINDWLTWGALTYPIAFLVTDLMNRLFGARISRMVVYAGFAVGVILSFTLADPRIAIASGSAFLVAQLIDISIFNRIRQQTWWKAPLISSFISSAIDTALFFFIAFYDSGLPWITWATGDYGAKLVMAAILLLPFKLITAALKDALPQGSNDSTA